LEFPTGWVVFAGVAIIAVVLIAYYLMPDVICPTVYKGHISPDTRDPIEGACSAFSKGP